SQRTEAAVLGRVVGGLPTADCSQRTEAAVLGRGPDLQATSTPALHKKRLSFALGYGILGALYERNYY
ncbi:MAG: hypothetical protein U9R25_16595, partial [Chloroflexota bacterium]|nr:hypothetical protein [Chloroflexota bacterium]